MRNNNKIMIMNNYRCHFQQQQLLKSFSEEAPLIWYLGQIQVLQNLNLKQLWVFLFQKTKNHKKQN